MKRNAFTMLELVFVIVVIGILASVAVTKLAATRDDAEIAKGRSDVSAIRSAIVSERQTRLLQGQSSYISKLDALAATTSNEGDSLFDDNDTNATNGSLLQYGIAAKDDDGHWMKTADKTYAYKIMSVAVSFIYDSAVGKFDCNTSNATYGTQCKLLIN